MAKQPLTDGLKGESSLCGSIEVGTQALKRSHKQVIAVDIRRDFYDSIDLDRALASQFPNDPRWDYLLGHGPSTKIVALEVHPATDHEVKEVVRKKEAARSQLNPHLKEGKNVARWFWVAAGKVAIVLTPTSRSARELQQNGILFVGRRLQKKDLT